MSVAACRIFVLMCLVAAQSVSTARAEPMRERRVRTLLEMTRAVYQIYYQDAPAGTETIVRHLYDDNTIVYDVDIEHHMRADAGESEKTRLVLEDETHFPRSFHTKKVIENAGKKFETRIDIEMFANVARRVQTVGEQSEQRNFVLPTGTPLVGTGAVYPVYQLLFWYDRKQGGRQAFEVFEVSHKATDKVILELNGRETVAFDGQELETDVFLMQWPTHNMRLFVDDTGRVIVAELGYLRAELAEWTEGEDGEGLH